MYECRPAVFPLKNAPFGTVLHFKAVQASLEEIAIEGDRNYPLASVYPFSGPTACQGVPCFTAHICLFPQLFKYMKIAYLYQTGSYALLDLLIVEWSNKRETALIKWRAWWFQHKHSRNHPSLPRINKWKATSDPGTFRHAGSGGAAVPPSLSIINSGWLATVVSTLLFSCGFITPTFSPRTQNRAEFFIYYHTFTLQVAQVLLSLFTFQCIYIRAAKLCPQLRHHGFPTCAGKVLGTNSVFASNSQLSSASTW